jgi:hypothetical protein
MMLRGRPLSLQTELGTQETMAHVWAIGDQ